MSNFLKQIRQRLENHRNCALEHGLNIVYTHIVVNHGVFMALLKETGHDYLYDPRKKCELKLWGLKVVVNTTLKEDEHFVLVDCYDPITSKFLGIV